MMRLCSFLTGSLVLLAIATLLPGCTGPRSSEEAPPDERFGHRYADEDPDGRRTLTIVPPDSARSYFYYPVPIDTAIVRPEPFEEGLAVPGQEVAVEVLVKGAFPDACSELHAIRQERALNIINATLEMRKPQGAICASIRRPYRFYVMLEGAYGVGNYTLKLNDLRPVTFQIRAPQDQTR